MKILPTKASELSWLPQVKEITCPLNEHFPIWVRHKVVESGPLIPHPEVHPYFEVTAILGGSIAAFVGRESKQMQAGDYFLAGSGIPRWVQGARYPIRLVSVYFLPSALIDMGPVTDSIAILRRFTDPKNLESRVLTPPSVSAPRLETLMLEILHEFEHKPFGHNARMRALLLDVLVLLLRCEQSGGKRLVESSNSISWYRIAGAIKFLRDNFTEDIYARKLAAAVGVSESALKSLFQQSLGMPWTQYLRRYRVHRAVALLSEPGANILETSLAVGFQSLSHFNATFRSVLGASPSAYSKRGSRGASSIHARRKKKLYWIQHVKGHPVHRLTQIALREGARKCGFDSEIVGTEGPDIDGILELAERVLARGDAAGLAVWAGSPAYNVLIERAGLRSVPVVLPHFPCIQGAVSGVTAVISCDPAEYARMAALEIGHAIGGKGMVALTLANFNTLENLVVQTFTSAMGKYFPDIHVLEPVEEGFVPVTAVTRVAEILRSNPDITAAFSATGGGAAAWAAACRKMRRAVVIIGMDYTRENLNLVRNGFVHALIGQPLWDESFGAAELLAKAAAGENVMWWTKLPAPLIKRANLEPYYELLDRAADSSH